MEVAPSGYHTGGVYELYGRGWLIKSDPEGVLKPIWSKVRIRGVGNVLTTWLNGKQMIHLLDDEIGRATGFIALQIHDDGGIRVKWKSIYLTRL